MTRAINVGVAEYMSGLQPQQGKKLLLSSAESVGRIVADASAASKSLDTKEVGVHMERLIRPKSLSGTMRKVGIALVVTPDPFTGVPGVALIGASLIARRKEPIGLSHLATETRKVLRDLQSLSL